MKETDHSLHLAILVGNLSPLEQPAHYPHVLTQLAQRAWRQAHRPPGAVAGADTQDYSTWGELVDSGDGVRGDRRNAGAGHCYAGAELDALRLLRDEPAAH